MQFQNEDPIKFLESQGWQYKRKGEELVTSCPLCEKPDHFYLHAEKGVWKCHKCGEKGNLYQLRKRLGLPAYDGNGGMQAIKSFGQAVGGGHGKKIPLRQVEEAHAALLNDKEALEYCLQERRWAIEVIKAMRLGLRNDARGKWLVYPYWRKGNCVALKYRILPAYQEQHPGRFEREPGCESILFNEDAVDRNEEIILASGEADALSFLTLEFQNVVGTPTGEGSLPSQAVEALAKKQKILVCYDNDAPGQKGAREVAKRIGPDRVRLVHLPEGIKDANKFLTTGGSRQELERLLASAAQVDIPTICSLPQALDRLEQQKATCAVDQTGDMTPWATVNKKIGLWGPGNLIVVSGPQGTGKTTLCTNVASHWAAKDLPALVYCLEMNVEELAQHILCAHYKITEDQINEVVIGQARNELADWPLYLGANPRLTGVYGVTELLKQAVLRFGLKLVVFDNLHMLARSVDHRSEEVGVITKSFKLLAMELEIPIVLIAQPRKLEPGRVMTCWDLKDSVDIFSDADQIILLHREHVGASKDGKAVAAAEQGSSPNYDAKTLVRLAKARHKASTDSVLFLEGAQHRFRELGDWD